MTATRIFALLPLVVACGACGPAYLKYTVRVETEPSGARIYDPRTDQPIGETPMEFSVEYQKVGLFAEYIRKQNTLLDSFNAQDPKRATEPRKIKLNDGDYVRMLLYKDGYKKVDQQVGWFVTEVDGQTIVKRIFLEPYVEVRNKVDTEDVFR
jgi:hypothetical protein